MWLYDLSKLMLPISINMSLFVYLLFIIVLTSMTRNCQIADYFII